MAYALVKINGIPEIKVELEKTNYFKMRFDPILDQYRRSNRLMLKLFRQNKWPYKSCFIAFQ